MNQPKETAPPKAKGPTKCALDEIDVLIRSRYPVLYLVTHEESRLESLLGAIANKQGKPLFSWSITSGLNRAGDVTDSETATPTPANEKGEFKDPLDVLKHIRTSATSGLYLLKDFHPFLDDTQVVRSLRDVANDLKGSYKNILICSPRVNLPIELEKDVTLIDFPLPDADELLELLKSVCTALIQRNKDSVKLTQNEGLAIVRAAQGLTLSEAENVFAKAVVEDSVFDARDIALIHREKQQIIRKSGILDFQTVDCSLQDIGGLENLKKWLQIRNRAFSQQATDFGLSIPKGVLLIGAPGCGKSLTAKAVASAWQLPLLRLDFGRIFSGLVGSSEENMRRALKVAESVAPAVLWIDEVEKGLAGGAQGSSDGGTAARVFGTFLTWMQEKTAKVFVIATANRIEALPPELLRRGRFDEIFFTDLPETLARQEIFSIHLKKKHRKPENFDLAAMASASAGFSGAEIEHCVSESMFAAFNGSRDLTTEDVVRAIRETIPLSVTSAEELKRIREWASKRARSADAPALESVPRVRASHIEIKK
jgi:ATP-dependent 26S proteasome regulatory subunit